MLHAGGKVFEGSGSASSNPSDVVRPAPGAAHATERALLDLVDSIRCARLQRFAVGGFGPLLVNPAKKSTAAGNGSADGADQARATHNGAARVHNGLLAELGRG